MAIAAFSAAAAAVSAAVVVESFDVVLAWWICSRALDPPSSTVRTESNRIFLGPAAARCASAPVRYHRVCRSDNGSARRRRLIYGAAAAGHEVGRAPAIRAGTHGRAESVSKVVRPCKVGVAPRGWRGDVRRWVFIDGTPCDADSPTRQSSTPVFAICRSFRQKLWQQYILGIFFHHKW